MSIVAIHENNYDTSRKQKRFHTIRSQKTLQIIPIILVELAKSVDWDFSRIRLTLKKFQLVVQFKRLASYFAR